MDDENNVIHWLYEILDRVSNQDSIRKKKKCLVLEDEIIVSHTWEELRRRLDRKSCSGFKS